ncbi:MAG: hypothetical protein WC527_00675 [Candidatus Margulisiibacteriota bacterium]
MKYLKALFYGSLAWLIPFITSFFFYDFQTQKLLIDEEIFKWIITFESVAVGMVLIFFLLKSLKIDIFRLR